jgi:protocatechuate 3,4-dioxygenase, alpha subunit
MSNVPTASQTVGPFFSIGLSALCRENIGHANDKGERVTICGRVLDGDGKPVPDAVLEIWQASEIGLETVAEGVPNGFGRIATNERGEFRFTTSKPEARREAEGTVHAPHVVVLVLMRGLQRHLLTRVYFGGDAEIMEDIVLTLVPADRRATLIASRSSSGGDELQWDIYLQGERETVFFEA